jgi:hypothetical protein
MPKAKSISEAANIDPSYVRMYYEHQYDRIKKNEDQAMNISNIVFTITALILTFGFNNQQLFGSMLILFLPVIIIIANVFAILYIRENTRWIKVHQIRAKLILETYVPELYSLDKDNTAPPMKGIVDRSTTQYLFHILFITIAFILLFLFVMQLYGNSII